MHTVQYFAILLGAVFILPWNITHAATSDPVGTTYPSQKISFTDPVTNRTVWRMTVDGTQHGALNNISDASGMESDKFAPNGNTFCYAKTGHPSKPNGFYVMNVSTGIETYVAPIGNSRWGACTFSKTSNELFVVHTQKGTSIQTTWTEVRAINLSTYAVRVLRRYQGGTGGNDKLSVNKDGTYIAFGFAVADPNDTDYRDNPVYNVILKTSDGSEHPQWRFDPASPDDDQAGDFPYWHPVNPKGIRWERNGVLKIWDIDTLSILPNPTFMGETSSLYEAHNCQTVDGAIQFHTWGHADCHPLDVGKGPDTRAVIDRRQANAPYIYITAFKDADGYGSYPPDSDRVAVHYNYADGTHNYAHSHPHFSRDARYVLFSSAVNNTTAGTPPGGADSDTMTVDLFVIPLTTTTTPPPTTPSTCTNQQTSTASIPTGYGASYNPLTSAREYLVQASCTNTTSATITAGNGNPLTYVYNRGYYYSGTAWTPYTLTCASGALISGAWCPGRATASIPLPQNPTNVIAYTCQYTNNTWKCGCRDATCSTAYWQLQRVGR